MRPPERGPWPGPELRIGDAEREAAVAALGEHYVAGRLTKEEYDERSAAAWQARTGSELAPLFRDLPALPRQRGVHPAAATVPMVAPGARARTGPRFPLLPLVLVLVGLAMLTEGWLVLVLVGVLWWTGAFRWLRGTGTHPGRGGTNRR